jgi:hypothetical protein
LGIKLREFESFEDAQEGAVAFVRGFACDLRNLHVELSGYVVEFQNMLFDAVHTPELFEAFVASAVKGVASKGGLIEKSA